MNPEPTPTENVVTAPAWLPTLLRAADFRTECLRATEAAYHLTRMRRVAPQLQGSLRDVASYLDELTAMVGAPHDAGATLAAVQDWANFTITARADARFGAGWGRVASALGIGNQEASLRLRLTVAREVGQDLWPVMARTRDAELDPVALLSDCAAFLDEAVPHWSPDARDRLAEGESALRAALNEADDAP
jgi:hypothetical protein